MCLCIHTYISVYVYTHIYVSMYTHIYMRYCKRRFENNSRWAHLLTPVHTLIEDIWYFYRGTITFTSDENFRIFPLSNTEC